VLRLGHPDEGIRRTAMENFCETYWGPIHSLAKKIDFPGLEPADLTQDFFLRFVERNSLGNLSEGRGKLRSWLKVSFRNFCLDVIRREQRQKRAIPNRAELTEADEFAQSQEATAELEANFDREWAQALFKRAQSKLQKQYTDNNRATLFEEISPLLTDPDFRPTARLAARLHITDTALRATMKRFTTEFAILLREEVAATLQHRSDVDDELRYLLRALTD
jgi:RNA polymerase sigma factor (sigma-70 family)